jgi:AcrR family transcriptional regulator
MSSICLELDTEVKMSTKSTEDRRSNRTREHLQRALFELLETHAYDAITIQQIADCADVSRATFYLHFESKDALYLTGHTAHVHQILGDPLSREELLDTEPPQRVVDFYTAHWERRDVLRVIFFSKDSRYILQDIEAHSAERLHVTLARCFPEANSDVPLDLLAEYLAGAQMRMMTRWLERRLEISPPTLAQVLQRLQRAALREALGIM